MRAYEIMKPLYVTISLWLAVLAICTSSPAARPNDKKRFADPSIPALETLPGMEPPQPKPHPDVRFHAKPKLLPPGAVVHDWTSFLGPTHNAVSTETKLLKKWPASGPSLVWELKKGKSYTSPAVQRDRLVFFHRLGDEEIVECLHPETG